MQLKFTQMQPYSIIAALELLVTFEVMTQVPQRDEVMAAVNRLFGFFLLLFIDLYFFDTSKKMALWGKGFS